MNRIEGRKGGGTCWDGCAFHLEMVPKEVCVCVWLLARFFGAGVEMVPKRRPVLARIVCVGVGEITPFLCVGAFLLQVGALFLFLFRFVPLL